MKFISKFEGFDSVNEATMGDDKIGKSYMMSRTGRVQIDKLGITEDITLKYSSTRPNRNEMVIWIKSSSISVIEFSELRKYISTNSIDIMVYKTSSRKYKWAVVKKGINTTMIKQKDKEGSSMRGDHFRETAFIITLAVEAWRRNFTLDVHSNRGKIDMVYNDGEEAFMSTNERAEFRNQYDTFMSNSSADCMRKQCNDLIDRIGGNISNIDYIIKNTSNLDINKKATMLLKSEISQGSRFSDIPHKFTIGILPKWNPSDMWIFFKDAKIEANTLEELNGYLGSSIANNNGIIGVSLKQSSNIKPKGGNLFDVNMSIKRATHRYDSAEIGADRKTVIIYFSYKFGDNGAFTEGSEIHLRTFDTSPVTSISLEVKGSRNSEHMSGKAGSLLKAIMPDYDYDIKEFVRLNNDKDEIREYLDDRNYQFITPEFEEIFMRDLDSPGPKTGNQGSRMQSIIVVEWLNELGQDEASKIITKIVRFAKSESDWSAPHLLTK